MANGTRICKICGAEYPYCKTAYVPGAFRYQDVACCAEHGSEYLAKITASREEPKAKNDTVAKVNKPTTKVATESRAKAKGKSYKK